jgi:hypothetical protein
MALIRCMVIFDNVSMLPEDRYVNTWWFEGAGLASVIGEVAEPLESFYKSNPGTGDTITDMMSASVKRGTDAAEMRFYDMAHDEPRSPVIRKWTVPPHVSVEKLPNEVSICLSFKAAGNRARERGRVYLGPWRSGILSQSPEDSRPQTWAVDCIAEAAEDFLAAVSPAWVVHSEKYDETFPVVSGWVDNAWDIQRRRGADPTTRRLWPN